MKTNNYFRAGRAVFFFNSSDEDSIRAAWDSATVLVINRGRLAVYHPFDLPGPWSLCNIIGFSAVGEYPSNALPEVIEDWQHRRDLRAKLWAAKATHVNTIGMPCV